MSTKTIAVIVGSLRKGSINRMLANALIKLAPDELRFDMARIDDLPLFNQDDEQNAPESVARFKARVAAADALLFVTPEHNRSMPAALKNAVDWGSRPKGQNSWGGKPAAIAGASPGALATALAQHQLRGILGNLNMLVMPQPAVYVHFAPGLIDADGNVTDEPTLKKLQKFLDRFAAWIDRLAG